jgi:hypothetical protein
MQHPHHVPQADRDFFITLAVLRGAVFYERPGMGWEIVGEQGLNSKYYETRWTCARAYCACYGLVGSTRITPPPASRSSAL